MAPEFSHRSLHSARAGRRRLLFTTILVIVLIVLDALSHGAVRGAVRSVGADIWTGSSDLRADITGTGYFVSHRTLAEENAALRAQVAQYQEKAAGYDVLAQQNAQLQAALSFSSETHTITAPIVSSFTSSPYGTFLIGADAEDGVAAGDLVISDGGFVIGQLADVQTKTSEVRELFSAGEHVDGLVDGTPVTLIGDGGGNAHASVPLGVHVAAGDPIISPTHGGRAVGVVGHIDSSATSPDQTVYVQLPVNLASLQYVYVVYQ